MTKFKQDFLVGMVFLSGLVLVGTFTIVIQDITVFKGRQGQLTVLFDRVSGLERGHKVLASGMEVGQVSELLLQEDGTVKVDLSLVRPLKLYDGYKIAVKDTSALGGKYVDINIGNPASYEIPVAEIKELSGASQPSLFDDPNLREAFVSLKDIARTIETSLKEEEKRGTLALLITQRDLYDNILAASENLKLISSQIQNPDGTIGKLLYEKEMADDLGASLANIRRISRNIDVITDDVKFVTARIRSGQGTIGRLIKDPKLYDDARATLASTRKVMDNLAGITDKIQRGEGTVGKLLVEEEVYDQLNLALRDARTMMQGISQAVGEVNEGKGTFAALLHDEQLALDLRDTVSSLRVVTQRLKTGEGTIGKLLADETLYRELQRVVQGFSDSLEDTREQVPISTFTSLLFKAF